MIKKWLAAALYMLSISMSAQAQQKEAQDNLEYRLILTITYVENCLWMDDLLRKNCSRIAPHLSEKNKKYCEIPVKTFKERIATSYPAFRERFREKITRIEPKLSALLTETRQSLEKRFAEMRAGKVAMMDLESLSRELKDRCVTIETEWLSQNREPKK